MRVRPPLLAVVFGLLTACESLPPADLLAFGQDANRVVRYVRTDNGSTRDVPLAEVPYAMRWVPSPAGRVPVAEIHLSPLRRDGWISVDGKAVAFLREEVAADGRILRRSVGPAPEPPGIVPDGPAPDR